MDLLKKNKYPKHLEDDLSFGKQVVIFIWEVVKVVVISLAIIVPVRYFLIKPFYVNGASMEPNFHDHEYLIIDEITYRFNEPQRGDIVVFRYPLDPSQYFIKRIVGLPNEKFKIIDGNVIIFNDQWPQGEILGESYLEAGVETSGEIEIELGDDEYYILGDNRIASLDSRVFGPIKRQAIVGRTWLRGWPLNRIGVVLSDAEYNL